MLFFVQVDYVQPAFLGIDLLLSSIVRVYRIDNALSGIQTSYTVVILMVVLWYLYISSSSFSSLFLRSFLLVLYLGNHNIYRLFKENFGNT